jgi:GT2 family glycosyltransferase
MMLKIGVHIVRYNQPLDMLIDCIEAAIAQDYPNFTVRLTENGSRDSVEEAIRRRFEGNSKFEFFDNGENLGFAGAHNKYFAETDAQLVMPLNPDAIMQYGFLTELASVFLDPKIAAAEGKMLKPNLSADGKHVLDGTGIVISRTRRARERGQLEVDHGQFDTHTRVFGVSGTAPLYRKSALDAIKLFDREYFDEDFFAYWEDLDLSWRFRLAGFECVYVPRALVLHERVGGQSRHGYKRPLEFMKHHRKFSTRIRRFNWRNHLFTIIKNDFGSSFWSGFPFILARESAMLVYITFFETSTLGEIPNFCRLLPRMLRKRAMIQRNRKISSEAIGVWFKQKHS